MAAEVQTLLRFLTKDARIPLAEAMPKIHALRKQQLNTPESISKADEADLKPIFADEKVLKQVINAAKRASNPKKRAAAQSGPLTSKRTKADGDTLDDETSLALPQTKISIAELENVTIETNRAPLFLAFTIAILAYTHPEQPLSSRWSLAQAVVSAGAQSKAKYLGLTTGPTAEEDGWAQGQPKVKIMGREVAVMRRHIAASAGDETSVPSVAFWGLDLDALRKSNGPLIVGKDMKSSAGPPIHKPLSPRNYLLKSMIIVESSNAESERAPNKKTPAMKTNPKELASKREEAAAMVLKAIDTVCKSWTSSLSPQELDQRAQAWYARVRPDVEQGQAGWGQRGQVRLAEILALRKMQSAPAESSQTAYDLTQSPSEKERLS
ncbi:uncharacterized protein Z519_05277 [Cladophialophora bantiana CBS 173.52]|uniref:Impact N-terminal domain-containing protein n=1 Tax=Cladophialophora bantiana (strain ATCC 10958 / CBS 173.52 / CDC B-1940 / NIH 8579) TaxID=1442370 RepID=A0A0D2G5T7_CLAB1|nr:uncharacterized protein Z519_05277 [Cladophialophora bantiana CBS 173.52]KIW93962.1 hypothetical protein Z519_05277 [Cladophialophora bantiana CBS 173.52]